MLMMWQMATPKQKRLAVLITGGVVLSLFFLVFMIGGVQAYADIFDTVHEKFMYIYTRLSLVITGIAVVAIGICAIRWLFGSDPSSVRMAKQWLLNIVIGLVIYWLAWLIVTTVQDMTAGYQPPA